MNSAPWTVSSIDGSLPATNAVSDNISRSTAHGAPSTAAAKTGTDFESMFLSEMLGHMFDGVGEDELSGGEQSQEIYRSWLTDQYGKIIATHGGIGIASMVQSEILKIQEAQANNAATASHGA